MIDSLCKTILTVDEILEILNHPKVDNITKTPFIVYLQKAYLKSGGGEIGTALITHHKLVPCYYKVDI